MKTIYVTQLLGLIFLISFINYGYSQTRMDLKSSNGLNTASFDTDHGKVNVYFPDLQEGDIISGTVLAEPAGKNERQKARNSNVISGYVVEVENYQNEDKTILKDKVFQWVIPAVLTTGLNLVIKNPKGEVVGKGEIPIMADVPYMEMPSVVTSENFGIPEFIQSGSQTSIPGIFDGDFSNTSLNIGGENVDVLAESPRGIFFESPDDLVGPTDVVLNEGDVKVEGQTTAFELSLTADRLTLQRGENTTVHISVAGLSGLDQEIPVDISNLTENTVILEGGNNQTVIIEPEDISPGGKFTADIPVRAISSGGFSVAVNVKPPQPVIFNRIYPDEEVSSPEPNFIWSVLNAPPESTFRIKIWDVKAFSSDADRQSFSFSSGMVGKIDPVIAESGLEEPSFAINELVDFQLLPDHMYAWQVSIESGVMMGISSPVWHFSVNGSGVKDNFVHIREGQYTSKYYPRGWVHIRRGEFASKIYNPATHRHLTAREYNTKIYSTEDYKHITRDKDKTKIYPANLRHITSGENETYLYNPETYQPHQTTGPRASILIPQGYNHLINEADRTKIYPESDRHLTSGDNNTKIVPAGHEHLTRDEFNSKIYPRSARHINWGTTNVTKIIPEGMVHIDSGDDLSKIYAESDKHLKGGTDNTKIVPSGSEHVTYGADRSKVYPSGNSHIRTGENASGIYNPESETHKDMGRDQTKIIPKGYYHISSGAAQTKYGPSGARHIGEGVNATKLHTRDGENIEPGEAENPSSRASEPGRPGDSSGPDRDAVKPEKEAGRPSAQPQEPGEPQEPKEKDEW